MFEKFDIIVVGAGLSGLAAAIQCALSGHNITILESAKELAEIGAGLQLTPNSTRILQKWNVYPKIRGPCEPTTCTVYSYKGETLAHEDSFNTNTRQKYGAPFADVHRVDLQQALVARARELGVTVVLDARVTSIDFGTKEGDKAKVVTESKTFEGDLVVGADGLWSTCRSALLGTEDKPLPTGDLAFRIVLRIHQLWDEDLRKMVQNPGVRFWIGPDAHVVAYSVRGGSMYNVVLLVPDDLPESVARTEGSLEEMKKLFEGWDPVLTRLLSHVKHVDKWKLMHRSALPTWLHPHSNLVLIGDSCHPMLPYLAQGANSSIEDGAALGLLLAPSICPTKPQLPSTLALFQRLRKARGEAIANETFKQRRDFHLPDGEEQRRRDEVFKRWMGEGEVKGEFPSRWTCPVVQPWLWGYDVEAEVEGAVAEMAVM
ncbi:FAD binding domain-containing protein [Aaosphaeria arxii CBS 175.79]|uniref:FAD binding domain-containing protein n=1 Tax=Aaosphaeria arxii CBS 175.79 TaxID=1450172 RepID=A0A6A5XMC4_9PLEO|nr:FAD binding domain-containing protein [Aaosphaeria arxii CBS 175.79]KAF2014292.1 FAD binding domain-containing protein [Aaosphaeria arxii CBS 175.79]